MAAIDAKARRKRARTYTVDQMAAILGCHPTTVYRIEARPLSPRVEAYLRAIGYRATFNPQRKGQD